jgi:hypothetical protein
MKLMTLVGLVLSAVAGLYIYSWQVERLASSTGASSASGIIDAVAVKADLLSMAGAERQQFALEGKYVSLEELRKKGVPLPEGRGDYKFSAEVTPMTFLIKAVHTPTDGSRPAATMTIGPDMQVRKLDGAAATEDE